MVTVEGPGGRSVHTIEKPFARMGTHEGSEVVLPQAALGRRELYLHATAGGVFCVDLARDGAARDRIRGWLGPQQWIQLGGLRISARLSGQPAAPGASAEPDLEAVGSAQAPLPVIVLTVDDQEIGRRSLIRRLTVVGRHRPCPIRLSSHSVSSPHSILYWHDSVLWVVDLLSSNGTWKDDQRIEAVALALGDSICLGRIKLTFAMLSEDGTTGVPASPISVAAEASGLVDQAEDDWIEVPPQPASSTEQLSQPCDSSEDAASDTADGTEPIPSPLGQHEIEARLAAWQQQQLQHETEYRQQWAALQQLREEMEAGRESLCRQQAELEAGRQQLQLQQQAIAIQRGQLQAERDAWEAERMRLSAGLAEREKVAEEETAQLRAMAARAEDHLASLASQQQALETQQAAWQAERSRQEDDLLAAGVRLQQQADDLDKLRADLDAQRQAFARQCSESRIEQDAWETRRRSIESELATRTTRIEDESRRIQSQAESCNEQASRYDALQRELDAQRAAWQSHCEQIESQWMQRHRCLDEQADRLTADQREFQRRSAAWEADRVQLESQWNQQSARLAAQAAKLEADQQEFEHQRAAWQAERIRVEAASLTGCVEQADETGLDESALEQSNELVEPDTLPANPLPPVEIVEAESTVIIDLPPTSDSNVQPIDQPRRQQPPWLPVAETDEDPNELMERLTDHLIRLERSKRRRWQMQVLLWSLLIAVPLGGLALILWFFGPSDWPSWFRLS